MVLRLEDAISMIIRKGGRKRQGARRRGGMRDKQMRRMEEWKRRRNNSFEIKRGECAEM